MLLQEAERPTWHGLVYLTNSEINSTRGRKWITEHSVESDPTCSKPVTSISVLPS